MTAGGRGGARPVKPAATAMNFNAAGNSTQNLGGDYSSINRGSTDDARANSARGGGHSARAAGQRQLQNAAHLIVGDSSKESLTLKPPAIDDQ